MTCIFMSCIPGFGLSITGDCVICSIGSFSLGDGSACSTCEYSKFIGASNCEAGNNSCGAGQYSLQNTSSTCQSVPSGYYNPATGKNTYYVCPDNTFSSAGSSSCSNCAAGQVSSPGASYCSVILYGEATSYALGNNVATIVGFTAMFFILIVGCIYTFRKTHPEPDLSQIQKNSKENEFWQIYANVTNHNQQNDSGTNRPMMTPPSTSPRQSDIYYVSSEENWSSGSDSDSDKHSSKKYISSHRANRTVTNNSDENSQPGSPTKRHSLSFHSNRSLTNTADERSHRYSHQGYDGSSSIDINGNRPSSDKYKAWINQRLVTESNRKSVKNGSKLTVSERVKSARGKSSSSFSDTTGSEPDSI